MNQKAYTKIMKSSINLLITAGGTSESIDNMRRIANTGRLGSLIADAFSGIEGIAKIMMDEVGK